MAISAPNLATLRTHPQKSKLYLVVQQPMTHTAIGWTDYVWAGHVTTAPAGDPITALSVETMSRETWCAICGDGKVFRSFDGATWTEVVDTGPGAWSIATDGNGIWCAGNIVGRIFRSTDNGSSWPQVFVGAGQVTDIATDNAGNWCAVNDVTYYSNDSGATWNTASPAFPGLSVAYGNGVWCAGGAARLWRSVDSGATWTTVLSGINNVNTVGYGNGVWCAGCTADGRIYRSIDDGVSWTLAFSVIDTNVTTIAYGNGVWLAGTSTAGKIYRSTDNGVTWAEVYDHPGVATARALSYGDGLWCVAFGSDIYSSNDGGLNWALADSADATVYAIDNNADSVGGSFDLLDGMTVFIGSELGGWDKGVVRLHGDQTVAETGVDSPLYIAVSSDLRNVEIGDYVVVLNEFRFWNRYPRVTETGGALTWYKDYGVFRTSLGDADPGLLFSDLAGIDAIYPPVPVMGSHVVQFIDPGDTVDVDFDWSDSYAVADGVTVDAWASDGENGGAGWTDNVENPAAKTYSNISGLAGYRVTLEVETDSDDPIVEFRRGVRFVFTLRRPGQSQTGDPDYAEPITDFNISAASGSFSTGYWRATITVFEEDNYTIWPGALVILFADDYYGDTLTSVSPYGGRENIVLVGRVADGSITQDSETHSTTFDIISVGAQASQRENYAVPVEDNDTPDEWIYAADLTVDRASAWFACWHSTLPLITDFYLIDEDVPIIAQDFLANNFYSALNSFLDDRRYARLLFDRYERAKCDIDLGLLAEGVGETFWTLGDGDAIGEIGLTEINERPVSIVHAGGLLYNAGAITPYLSNAPGAFTRYSGVIENKTNLAVVSQVELNNLSGRHLATANIPYKLNINLGNWRYQDIWPQGYLVVSRDIGRHTFSGEKFIFREYGYQFDGQALTTAYGLDYDGYGPAGIGFSAGQTVAVLDELPSPPDPTEPNAPPRPYSGTYIYPGTIIGTEANGVYYATVLAGGATNWEALGVGLSGDALEITDLLLVTKNGRPLLYAATQDGIYEYQGLPTTTNTWSKVWNLHGAGPEMLYLHASTTNAGWLYWTWRQTTTTKQMNVGWTPNWFADTYSDSDDAMRSDALGAIAYYGIGNVWSVPYLPRTIYAACSRNASLLDGTTSRCIKITILGDNSAFDTVTAVDVTANDVPKANQCACYVSRTSGSYVYWGRDAGVNEALRQSTNSGAAWADIDTALSPRRIHGLATSNTRMYIETVDSIADLSVGGGVVDFYVYGAGFRCSNVFTRAGNGSIASCLAAGRWILPYTDTIVHYNGVATDEGGDLDFGDNITAIAHYTYEGL